MINNLIINLKYIIKKPIMILEMLLVCLLPIVAVIMTNRLWLWSSFVFEIPVIFIVGMLFSDLHHSWSTSTLDDNSKINNVSSLKSNIAFFITNFICMFIVVNLMLLFIYVLSIARIIEGINLQYLPLWQFYKSFFTMFIIVYLLMSICDRLSNNKKIIFIFMLVLTILSFVLGGTLNNYFHKIYHKQDFYFLKFQSLLFPKDFFYPSLFFPLYAPGQLLNVTIHVTNTAADTSGGTPDKAWIHCVNIIHWLPITDLTGINAINWDIVLITPIIWTLVLMGINFAIPKKENGIKI